MQSMVNMLLCVSVDSLLPLMYLNQINKKRRGENLSYVSFRAHFTKLLKSELEFHQTITIRGVFKTLQMIKFFAKIVNRYKLLTIFAKRSFINL